MFRRLFMGHACMTSALFVVLTLPAGAQAQTDSASPPSSALPQPQALDAQTLMKTSYESLVVVRPATEITADLQAARDAEKHFTDHRERVRVSSSTASDKITVMESDKNAIDQRIDLAKKGKMAAEQITLETQKKSMELQIKVLERDRELKKTHAEVSKKQVEEAQTRQRMLQLELELAAKRIELEQLVADSSKGGTLMAESLVRLVRDVRLLERNVLEARKERSEKAISAAEAEKSYVEKQLELLKAQAEALALK